MCADPACARKQGVVYVHAWPQDVLPPFPDRAEYDLYSVVDELQQPPVRLP